MFYSLFYKCFKLQGMMTFLVLKRRLTLYLTDIFTLQNIMTFNKCSINGKAYGDVVDEYGNPMDITEVGTHDLSDHYLQCIHHCNPYFKFRTPCLRMVYFGSGLFTRYYRTESSTVKSRYLELDGTVKLRDIQEFKI